jgi:ABC-2 type transport system permease protein
MAGPLASRPPLPGPLSGPDLWRLYWRLVGASTRAQMQYKASFLLAVVGTFAANIVEFGAVLVLFGRIPHLAGWSLGEVAMLWGMSAISFAVADMIATGFDVLPDQIRLGTFDRVLIRPLGAFFQTLAVTITLRRVGRIAQGVVVFALAQSLLALSWTPDRVAMLALALVCGAAIFFAIFVCGAAYSFWTVEGREVMNTFTYGGTTMASYPLDIFGEWLRRAVTFILPLAFVNYYPALYILGRPDPLGLPTAVAWLAPLAAALCCGAAFGAWSAGVRHYQSTGS